MSGLLAAINGGLNGSGLIAQDDGGVIRIVEISSPAWRFHYVIIPACVSIWRQPGIYSWYGIQRRKPCGNSQRDAGIRFWHCLSGLPEGTQRISAHRGNEYQIASTDGPSATVQRVVNGVVDSFGQAL